MCRLRIPITVTNMKSIYIINEMSEAAIYGIGSYITQLLFTLKESSYQVNVISLFVKEITEVRIEYKEGIRYIQIPGYSEERELSRKEHLRLQRNLYYCLVPYIPIEDEIIFHFNHMHFAELASRLKQTYTCKILLTVHFQRWCLDLLGDRERLQNLITTPTTLLGRHIQETINSEKVFLNEIVDRIIAVSASSRKNLCAVYQTNAGKISLIYNTIQDCYVPVTNEMRTKIRSFFHFSKDEKIIVFAGRLELIKGLEFLQSAFKELLENDKNIRLVVCGSGHFDYFLKTASPAWSRISFTGHIEKEILYQLFAVAEIGIAPSFHEEFGYVALEMMMNGLPIIVSHTSGLAEIIGFGEYGISFQLHKKSFRDSAIALKQKIEEVLYNPSFREEYAKKGREQFLQKFERNIQKEKMLTLYHTLFDAIEKKKAL